MEKFTNPKRVSAPVGGIGTPLRYLTGTNEHLLPLLLILFFTLLNASLMAQPFNAPIPSTAHPLNGFDVGTRSVPVFVDIDNDCDKDCFVGNQAGEIRYLKNTGTASSPLFVEQFGVANPMDGYTVSSNAKPAFVDIDADGDLDCFVGSGDGTISAFKNEGDVSTPSYIAQLGPNTVFFDGNPFDGEDVGSNASPVFMDYDSDGDYDCFVGRSNSTNSIRYYRNEDGDYNPMFNELTGGSNPLSNTAVLLGGIGGNGDITSNACLTGADFGAGGIPDGDIDIYVGVANGTFRYFRNNSGGGFTHFGSGSTSSPLDGTGGAPLPKDISASGTDYSSPAFVDIDGDGDLDCFSGRNTGTFVYYRNDAPATARTIICKPTYLVNLNANGLVTVNPATVNPDDLFLSTTFTCPDELTLEVNGTGTLMFTCSDATNNTSSNGIATTSYLTLTATDAASNTATCSAFITVLDKTPPVPNVTSLPAQTLDVCSVGNFPASYIPTATDVCSGTATLTGVPTPATLPGTVGQTTVTWTYTDSHGNTGTQTQVFNVVTNAPPTWTGCPGNLGISPLIIENQGAPNCGYIGSLWTVPVPSDCETIVSTSSSHTPTSFFPVGVTTVTYAAQDAGGNTGYCNFTVTVTDGIPPSVSVSTGPRQTTMGNPVIANLSSVPLNNDQGVCGASFSWLPADITVGDNCGGTVTLSVSHPSGTVFPIGPTVVKFIATDAGGSSTTYWSFTVVVSDEQNPSMTCPVPITIPTAPNSCTSATVNLSMPFATDNCPDDLTIERTDGSYAPLPPIDQPPLAISLPIGVHSFFFRAVDGNSNSSTCSYTITVVDQMAPSFGATCPTNQTLTANINSNCSRVFNWTAPTATDNCPGPTPMSIALVGPTFTPLGSTVMPGGTPLTNTGTEFNEGTTRVSYTATDGAGNTTTCSFTVKVTNTTPPTINCPLVQPVVVSAGANCLYTLAAVAGVGSTATAPCDPGVITYRTAAGAPLTIGVSTFGLGTHSLTAIATDVSNNSATCAVSIQVVDVTGPVLQPGSCPSNITVNSDVLAACGANVSWSAPVWTDNCNNAGIIVSRSATPGNMSTPSTATLLLNNAGGFFPVGITQVNFTAKDGPAITANIGTPCGFTVTVIDDDKPVVTCPNSPVVVTAADFAACNNIYTLYVPTVTDNGCSTALSVTYSVTGATTVPSLTPLGLTQTLAIGSSTITYSVTDAALNTGTCSYTVQVKDLTGPTFSCPSSQIIVLTSGCSGPAASWADPSMLTDCSLPVIIGAPTVQSTTGTPAPTLNGTAMARNGVFPVGITTLRYTAYDNASPSNSSTCTFTIDVRENIAPTITCPPAPQVFPATSGCSASISAAMLEVPAASDNCSTPVVTILLPSTFPQILSTSGPSLTVTWKATDASGNTAVCSRQVTVTDQTPPTLICSPFTVQVDVPGNNFIPSNAPTFLPGSQISVSDNCASLTFSSLTANPPLLPQYPVGTSFVNWQVSDGITTVSCSQQIIVTPNPLSCTPTTPSFSGGSNCGSVTPFVLPNANCPASVTVTAAQLGVSATDNCGNALAVPNQTFNVSVTGNTVVTFTATVGLNTVNCARTVSVTCNAGPCTPNAVPTMSGCGGTVNVNANASCQGVVASFGVTASDNCASRTVTASNSGPFPLGTTVVTFTASNTVGSNSCTKTVVVTDVTNPVFVSCPSDVTISPEPGEEFAFSFNLEIPGATDNCTIASLELAEGTPEKLFGDGEVVTWVVTDGSGNAAECLQNITVSTSTSPEGCADALGIEIASDGSGGDLFGYSVDIDGSRAIVGAPYDDNGKGINSGAAYIFEKDGFGNWVQVAKIIVPDGDADDLFGESVAIDGGLVIVGASKYNGKGAAFIFSGSGATWTLVKKLVASDGLANDDFGVSVDITSTHAIVGAPNDDVSKVNQGSVYIFASASSWNEIAKRVASDGDTNDNYGISVSIDGNFAVVGSRYDDDFGTNSGAAYVLNGGSSWNQSQKLTASDGAAGDYFGSSVAISGIHIIVGSYLDDYGIFNNAGSAYIFEDGGLSWAEVAKLVASDPAIADQFGISVSIESGVAVVGSHFDDDMGTNSGSAYVFTEGSGWSQVNKLTGSSVVTNDNFGRSVAIGGSSVVIGAYKDDISGLDQGSAYFFGCSNNPLRPEAKERTAVTTTTGGQVRCFPNPSTDVVNIDITLAEEENVQVIVSDISGKLIGTIFDNKMSGENRLQWEGKQFGNGMYFIRIQSASLREVVPVVIVR